MEEKSTTETPRKSLSCMPCFDALWFCYSPVHQMQQYYRLGVLDNCSEKWSKLFDCLKLKTKSSVEVQVNDLFDYATRVKLHIVKSSCLDGNHLVALGL